MGQQVCKSCGAPKDEDATFCFVCDTYLGWAGTEEVALATPTPTVETPRLSEVGGTAPPGPRQQLSSRPQHLAAPVASLKHAEVVVEPGVPGVFEIAVKNDSTIVDSFVVELAGQVVWLDLAHSETNLLPGAVSTVQVTLTVPPGRLAVAQRTSMPLVLRSAVDPGRSTPLAIDVVVPPSGPAASLTARPHLVRLHDATEGTFDLQLDNSRANFARSYQLSATDPEGVVRLQISPPVVEVPAGGVAGATVRFAAPAPPPGREVSRQLTVTALDPDGQVSVAVTIAQATSAPPESLPVRVRLEPATLTLVGTTAAGLNVVLDNRGGHEAIKLNLAGRDPAGMVGFRFDHARVAVPAGSLGYVGVVVETRPAARGATESRPFTVVAVADDGREIEAPGTLELSSPPDPITTARLGVQPEHLLIKGRKGTFVVDVDNRQGVEPLHVRLSGADEFGRARLTFTPEVLLVPPGHVARTTLAVQADRPPAGSTTARTIEVRATSHSGSVEEEATLTQQADDNRRLWGILLVLLGVCVLLPGLVLTGSHTELDRGALESAVRRLVEAAQSSSVPAAQDVTRTGAGGLVILQLLCAVLMLLGLTGGGRMVRAAAIVAVVCGFAVTAMTGILIGLPFVVTGAVLAFVGGVLLRR